MAKSETTKTKIYRELRASIITGRRRPGERLAIEELREEYGTSVTPVRDALQLLSQEALITIMPRSGYYVTRITLKELRDLLELREILEIAAVEKAAEYITEEQLAELNSVHGEYSGDDDESYTRYTDENRRYHYLIAKASKNHELAEMIGRLLDRLARFMVVRHAGHELEDIHSLLLERLRAHDVAGARDAIRREIQDSRHSILERIMETEAEYWHLGEGP